MRYPHPAHQRSYADISSLTRRCVALARSRGRTAGIGNLLGGSVRGLFFWRGSCRSRSTRRVHHRPWGANASMNCEFDGIPARPLSVA